MSGRAGDVRVRVTLRVITTLPASAEKRADLYGRTNFAECIAIDLDNDPAAFLMDAEDWTVDEAVSVE